MLEQAKTAIPQELTVINDASEALREYRQRKQWREALPNWMPITYGMFPEYEDIATVTTGSYGQGEYE